MPTVKLKESLARVDGADRNRLEKSIVKLEQTPLDQTTLWPPPRGKE